MLDVIEKLLVLQGRDRNILKFRDELARIPSERNELHARLAAAQASLESGKTRVKQIESDRKKLELDVEAKKQQIERYSAQQFQTKKNEEYRALSHEIETCRQIIVQLEDQELELMERAEQAQKEVAAATQAAADAKRTIDSRLADLAAREKNVQQELGALETNRGELAAAVEDSTRHRYERLLKQKGQNVMVGIQHGVCGGCHMQLSRQVIVLCRAGPGLVTCSHRRRLLSHTREMDLAAARCRGSTRLRATA